MSNEKNAYTSLKLELFPQHDEEDLRIEVESRLESINIMVTRPTGSREAANLSSAEARQLAKYLNLLADHQEQEHEND